MTYRDDDHSRSPDSHHYPMIGTTQHPSDALIAQNNGFSMPTSPVMPSAVPPQDVLRGGMDANTFLHALRRRWILATSMGLVAALASAIALWWLFPESTTATALFQVSSEQPVVFTDTGNSDQKFEILQKTQLALLNSHFVLQAAVRDPAISSLSMFAGEPDPVIWLQDNLQVSFPQQSEILSISLTGDEPPHELRQVVDAVAKAYREEVIYAEKQRRLTSADALARVSKKVREELETKRREFYDIAKEIGASDAYDTPAMTNLMIAELASLGAKRSKIEEEIAELRKMFVIYKQRLDDPALLAAQADQALAMDPQVGLLQQQLMQEQMILMNLQSIAKGGRSKQISSQERKVAGIEQQISQMRAEMKRQLMNQGKSMPNTQKQQLVKEFNLQIAMLQQELKAINEQYDAKYEEISNKVGISVDLMSRKADLEQLAEIAKDMSIKLETLEAEAYAPDRIEPMQDAVPMPNINTAQRAIIASLGGATAFGLVCLGIGYMEFRNRRLNGPEQVDEGLGIRVVGTLPSLSSRKALDAAHPIVAQLTESIDSVRTILMHDSTTKKRQVVLVTSPSTGEGRTTVASQLAASLARAGRRTLLVDGDLRSPALHALFDVPLEDGLCEVLRAEVDAADVIRPTHAEGLWLMTAGYCDVDAIHALATEQMQPVFDKLRAEYDFIIIDGAPVIGMSDALIFGQYCDGAVISVRRDFSQMPRINQTAELLRGVGIRIIGAVVNGVPTKSDDRVTQLRLIAPKSEREEFQPTA